MSPAAFECFQSLWTAEVGTEWVPPFSSSGCVYDACWTKQSVVDRIQHGSQVSLPLWSPLSLSTNGMPLPWQLPSYSKNEGIQLGARSQTIWLWADKSDHGWSTLRVESPWKRQGPFLNRDFPVDTEEITLPRCERTFIGSALPSALERGEGSLIRNWAVYTVPQLHETLKRASGLLPLRIVRY